MRYTFNSENHYFSGNRCEKVFSNKGSHADKGINTYDKKLELLFDRSADIPQPLFTIGIPRILNMYEEYPFWHTLFTACGIQVQLSDPSTFSKYETAAGMVMSDNICFPAKLVHSHIRNLTLQNVNRIFMPFVVFEKRISNSKTAIIAPSFPVIRKSSKVYRKRIYR